MLHHKTFRNLPKSFFESFDYLHNLGAVAFVANKDKELAEVMLAKFYESIEKAPYIRPDIYGLSGIGILLRNIK